MKDYGTNDVGSFQIKSGSVVVSDPCYDLGTWCQGVLKNVKNGKWNASTLTTDNHTAVLIASHESIKNKIAYTCPSWNDEKFEVGVDAGLAGIFDAPEFNSEDDNYDDLNSWYRRCCEASYPSGIIENSGVVSSSGFGDGNYICRTITKDNEIVAIMIDFGILEEDEEEPEEEEDYDEGRTDETLDDSDKV
jgi:hypothetical protein